MRELLEMRTFCSFVVLAGDSRLFHAADIFGHLENAINFMVFLEVCFFFHQNKLSVDSVLNVLNEAFNKPQYSPYMHEMKYWRTSPVTKRSNLKSSSSGLTNAFSSRNLAFLNTQCVVMK